MLPFCEIEDLGWQINAQTPRRPIQKKSKPPRFPPFPPFGAALLALLPKRISSPSFERRFPNFMFLESATHP